MTRTSQLIALFVLLCLGLWLGTGCETKIDDLGEVSLQELEGQPAEQATTSTSTPSTPTPPPTTTMTTTTTAGGGRGIGEPGQGGGFLWKPVSDSTRKLAVLLPPQYTGKVGQVYISTSQGVLIEDGHYGGVGNGARTHWRYSKQGGAYGQNVFVVAVLKAGGKLHWVVPNGAARTQF
ncbi:MAG: hypothetical protein GX803_05095 [Lentisphaerae bacterium]|nr:hypothetical protein [Lentisphaerota bacterium]